ncbi:sigma-70 family RNA polymerase sigma factor [Streptomyces sp. NPDC006733]|uniref:sigma-70 family RNA polymerase sigma factor n=1 Tax=Streptomyces sp. NPDC006733 TaxID=3155460 RepID=UPI00340B34E7
MPSRRVPEQREPESQVPFSDADLVARVRGGDDSAYEELYRRHAESVRRYARSCCRDAHTAEDLTGEVFARTLQAVRGGSGPDSAVRAYLLTTVRRVAASWGNTARREQLVEDFAVFAVSAAGSSTNEDTLDLGADVRAMHDAEQSLAIRAFRTLPERWQTVLWHTAVEEESPSEIAPLLGLTANATAVLAHRAREGLRQAYLQAHVSSTLTTGSSCSRYADRLGAHARGGLRMRADRELSKHLKECERCRAAALELADVNSALKGLLPVAVIGWFAAAYAAKVAGIVAGVGVASAAGGAAAAATGAASGGAASSGGAGAGAAAAEGLGVPAKAGIVAAVVVAAAGIAFAAMNTGHDAPAPKPRAKPPVAAPVTSSPPAPPSPKPKPKPSPEPPKAASEPPAPKPKTEPAAAVTPPPPVVTPSPTPTPAPKPSPTPTAEPAPTPTPTPSPAPAVFQVNQLGWSGGGDNTEPTVRFGRSSWIWKRWGLSVGGERYPYGITVGSPSSVLIDLNRGCTTYDALAGVDDLTMGLGAVRFSVYGDSGRLWRSQVVHGGDPAVPVNVDITGQRTIRLVVESAEHFSFVNVADWARSRISCT